MGNSNFEFRINYLNHNVLVKYTGSDKVISIPENTISIGENAFANLDFIETVIFPNSVTVIGKNAFQNSSISHITLPKNIQNLDAFVFSECKNLKTVTIQNPEIKFSEAPFKNASNNFEIIFNGTCTQFEETANKAFCGQDEYVSGDYHHPSATRFEYHKFHIYEHIFSDTLGTSLTCKVKCIDGELIYHERPKEERRRVVVYSCY